MNSCCIEVQKFPVSRVRNVSFPKVSKVLFSPQGSTLEVKNTYFQQEEEVSQVRVIVDVCHSLIVCIKGVRENLEIAWSAGKKFLRGDSLEYSFSVLTAYKTFLLITKTVSCRLGHSMATKFYFQASYNALYRVLYLRLSIRSSSQIYFLHYINSTY